jgi:uncharacterized protein
VPFFRIFLFLSFALVGPGVLVQSSHAQQLPQNPLLPPTPHAKQIHLQQVLVIGQTKGFEHESVSAAMVAI